MPRREYTLTATTIQGLLILEKWYKERGWLPNGFMGRQVRTVKLFTQPIFKGTEDEGHEPGE